jgi:hypothetical protein
MSVSTPSTHAIRQRQSTSITRGQRAFDTGTPDRALMQAHQDEAIAGADVGRSKIGTACRAKLDGEISCLSLNGLPA